MSLTKLDYATLEEQLKAAGAPITLAELHGALCGLFCSAGRQVAGTWLAEQVELLHGDSQAVSRAATAVEALESSSWLALTGTAMEFVPLLPDDETDLAARAAALGQWCVGFMGGLALGGWCEPNAPDEAGGVSEVVQDFIEISKAGLGSEDQADLDAAEFSYVELAEYIRVGVMVVFEALTEPADANRSPTVH